MPLIVALFLLLLTPSMALAQGGIKDYFPWVDVRWYGAKGNDAADDTRAFQAAITAVGNRGVLFVPEGGFIVSQTLLIDKQVSILGTGVGSQVYQKSTDRSLIEYVGVNRVSVRDIYLGSAATAPGASLITLNSSHHNLIENVTMLGGYYGLHLKGALLNTIIDLHSGTNFQGFFAATSQNQYWVYAERFNNFAANANTFIAPVLEGGVNGLWLNDMGGEGSLTITGGTIEGVSGTALRFYRTFLPSSVTGLHMEANGDDIEIENSSNISFSALFSLADIRLKNDTRNIEIADSIAQHITIGPNTKRIRIHNITSNLDHCGYFPINNQNPGTAPNGEPHVIISQVGRYCAGE